MLTLLVAYGWLFLGLFHIGISVRLYGETNKLPLAAHVFIGFVLWPIFLPIHLGHILAEMAEK